MRAGNATLRGEETDRPQAISGGRFHATTERYACSRGPGKNRIQLRGNEPQTKLWCLSIAGSQTAVRAIRANFLKGEVVFVSPIDEDGEPIKERAERMEQADTKSTWTWLEQKLPRTKATQTLVYPKMAELHYPLPEFLLLETAEEEPTEEERARRHYRRLNERAELPMHPQWGRWLWERAQEEGEAEPIEGLGLRGWVCKPDLSKLSAAITMGIKTGLLSTRFGR